MLQQDDYEFGQPDWESFETLFSDQFVEYRGMIFRKDLFNASEVDEGLAEVGQERIQWEVNHESMITYGFDIEIQRKWALELEKVWAGRFKQEFPHLQVKFDRHDTGEEVILTFWAEP